MALTCSFSPSGQRRIHRSTSSFSGTPEGAACNLENWWYNSSAKSGEISSSPIRPDKKRHNKARVSTFTSSPTESS